MAVTFADALKDRSLHSRYHQPTYTSKMMPFYIYGTRKSAHIDHVLLRAPNVQLSASQIKLDNVRTKDEGIFERELKRGAILHLIGVNEESMQPFSDSEIRRPHFFFRPGSVFRCSIFRDHKMPDGSTPKCKPPDIATPIATGKITLEKNIFVDINELNTVPSNCTPGRRPLKRKRTGQMLACANL